MKLRNIKHWFQTYDEHRDGMCQLFGSQHRHASSKVAEELSHPWMMDGLTVALLAHGLGDDQQNATCR